MNRISFFAQGIPKGQPRPRAFAFHGKARVYDPGTSEGWKSCIAVAAKPYVTYAIKEPVAISCVFVLPRPKSHYGTGAKASILRPDAPAFHSGKPDLDNYEKAVWDALVQIGLLFDDALIVQSSSAKIYTYGTHTGALITLEPANAAFASEQALEIHTAAFA